MEGAHEDNENEVFNLAKENNEMNDPNSLNSKAAKTSYVNQEMVSKIEKLEDQMVSGKDPISKKVGSCRVKPLLKHVPSTLSSLSTSTSTRLASCHRLLPKRSPHRLRP